MRRRASCSARTRSGIQYDGQVAQEGEGGGFSTAGGFNINWDGDWDVEATISEIGWSAEFAIPFRTLRYPRNPDQDWGVNFQRNIRRRNEQAYWSPLPRQYNIYRLSMAGGLENFAVPSQNNLKILPYVLGTGTREGVEDAPTENDGNVGLDVKYSLTPSLTLDGTINTDFAQVEVDELQINLDRFNLFFPEKRPFFLENAGYFTVGVPQEVELFYSRRIGLGPDGEIVPIDYGLRMSGKARDRYNIGLLYMQTDEVTDVTPENQFGVVRLNRDLPNRSGIGGTLISRRGHGTQAADEDYNWTYGLDGRWGLGQNGLIDGYVAQTNTPGLEGDDYSFRLGGSYDSEKWSLSAGYTEVADNFNPEVGYLTRTGYRKPDGFLMRTIRPEDLWGLLELQASRLLPGLLELRRLSGDRVSPHRQSLGVAQRLRGSHRDQFHSRRTGRAFRDRGGCDRAARNLRQHRGADCLLHESGSAGGLHGSSRGWRLLQRRPLGALADVAIPHR